jgi:endogenous inhibitor of DNA gyrase (YacG/DUF329 family)
MGVAQSRNRKGKIIEKARKGTYENCIQCGEEYYKKRNKKEENRKFCSRKCYNDWVKETGFVSKGFIGSADNRGEKNGRYVDGRSGDRGRRRKVKLRESIIERDGGNWCLLCGKPGPGLHLHRIQYGSQGGKYELDNCVQLCVECHGNVHSSKRKWMPILQEHIKNKKNDEYD